MPTPNLSGVIPILPTPFHDDESLDHASLNRFIEFFVPFLPDTRR